MWHLTAAYTELRREREAHSLPVSAQPFFFFYFPSLFLLEPAVSWFAFGILPPCTLLNRIPTVHTGSSSGRSLIFLSAEPPLIPCRAQQTASSTSDPSRHAQACAGSRTDIYSPITGLTVQAVLREGGRWQGSYPPQKADANQRCWHLSLDSGVLH